MQAFVDARYEYHWAPLIGCLVGQLTYIGSDHPSQVVGSVTGLSYQPPQDARLPDMLEPGLSALGVAPTITNLSYPNRLQRFRWRRSIRRELRADRPVTAFGVGLTAFGPAWGMIVGVDDERAAWRRDGPMTEQVSPWLSESDYAAASILLSIAVRRIGPSKPENIEQTASQAFSGSIDRVRDDLLDRIELLESDMEIEPQRFSHEAQTLAANWGETAAFWREHQHAEYTEIAVHMAITLSRYATLFPYPMGGQPNSPGVRSAAALILEEACKAVDSTMNRPERR